MKPDPVLSEPQQSAATGRLPDQATILSPRGALIKRGGRMSKTSWRQVLSLALAAFFVVGSLSNIFGPASIYEEYLKWGTRAGSIS
jgi:hypothetical protein